MKSGDLFIVLPKREDAVIWARHFPKKFSPGLPPDELKRIRGIKIPVISQPSQILLYVCEYRDPLDLAMRQKMTGFSRNVIFHAAIWRAGLYWISSEDAELRPIPNWR